MLKLLEVGPVEIKHLKRFEIVYETRSITAAAKKLFLTPQGLSRNIQELEQELGVVLFERTQRGVTPTAAAAFLYERTRELLPRFEAMERELAHIGENKARLRVGAANGVFNVVPFQTLLDFAGGQPELELEYGEYSNQEVIEMLRDSRLDFGLIVGDWKEPYAVTYQVGSCPVCLLVYEGHPLYEKEKVTIDMLREETLITMNEKFRLFHDFLDACRDRSFTPKILARTADANLQYRLCSQRLGLAVAPAFMADHFSMKGLRALPFEEDLQWCVYIAYMRNRVDLPVIQALSQYLGERPQ